MVIDRAKACCRLVADHRCERSGPHLGELVQGDAAEGVDGGERLLDELLADGARVVRRRGLREDAFQLEYTRHTIYLLRREDIIDVVNTAVNA